MITDDPPPSGGSALQAELAQRVPFRTAAQETLVGISRTASVIQRATGRLLSPHGISVAQYNVLRILRGAEPTGLPTLTVRDRMIDPAAAITRLTEKLARSGLIVRERPSADRRQVTCRITADGLALLATLDPVIGGLDAGFEAALSPEELGQFNRMMDRIREAFAAEA
ncbi:MAG TPA: hypothetical protein VFN22_01465 [Gemmatimonadales bacterium]|nr:hypothetical protein [Gemmatimonadales bacterium]